MTNSNTKLAKWSTFLSAIVCNVVRSLSSSQSPLSLSSFSWSFSFVVRNFFIGISEKCQNDDHIAFLGLKYFCTVCHAWISEAHTKILPCQKRYSIFLYSIFLHMNLALHYINLHMLCMQNVMFEHYYYRFLYFSSLRKIRDYLRNFLK